MHFISRLLFFVLPISVIGWGGKEIYTAATTKAPVTLTARDLALENPKASWVQISEGQLDFKHACFITTRSGKTPIEVYIPIVMKGQLGEYDSFRVLLRSERKEFLDPAKMPADSTGIVISGEPQKNDALLGGTVAALKAQYNIRLPDSFLVIHDGVKPGWMKGLGILAAGLAGFYLFTWGPIKKMTATLKGELKAPPPPSSL